MPAMLITSRTNSNRRLLPLAKQKFQVSTRSASNSRTPAALTQRETSFLGSVRKWGRPFDCVRAAGVRELLALRVHIFPFDIRVSRSSTFRNINFRSVSIHTHSVWVHWPVRAFFKGRWLPRTSREILFETGTGRPFNINSSICGSVWTTFN